VLIDLHKDGKLCKSCGENKPASAFAMRKSGRVGHLVAHCKLCNSAKQSARKKRDPSIYERIERPSKLKRQYGITVDEYDRLLESQDGKCAICASDSPGKRTKHFHVDHCHKTGSVRGLLCHKCNRAIGLFDDNPNLLTQASAYLKHGGSL
jgi:hypothetical protein